MNDAEYLDTIAASRMISLSADFVKKHSTGKREPLIPYLRVGGKIRFRHSDLIAFVESQNPKVGV